MGVDIVKLIETIPASANGIATRTIGLLRSHIAAR